MANNKKKKQSADTSEAISFVCGLIGAIMFLFGG